VEERHADNGRVDVEIIHVDSRADLMLTINRGRRKNGRVAAPFVIIQHSVSFSDVGVDGFAEGWQRAVLTASFQDLSNKMSTRGCAFHAMPWGADPLYFVPPRKADEAAAVATPRDYLLLIGDHKFGEETLGEALFASAHVGLRVRHVGATNDVLCECSAPALLCQSMPELGGRRPCDFYTNLGYVPTATLRREMQGARYVAALRKFEGFELAGVEALFCGTRPLVYDIPSYRWYRGHAVFVPSGLPPKDLFLQLTEALRKTPEPVQAREMASLHAKFSWQVLVPTFFDRVLAELRAANYF
jgi:hypothetical protein